MSALTGTFLKDPERSVRVHGSIVVTDTCKHPLSWFYFLNSFWSVVALRCCVSFYCTAKWIGHTCPHGPFLLDFLPIQVTAEHRVDRGDWRTVDSGQSGLKGCSPRGRKELDATGQLTCTEYWGEAAAPYSAVLISNLLSTQDHSAYTSMLTPNYSQPNSFPSLVVIYLSVYIFLFCK